MPTIHDWHAFAATSVDWPVDASVAATTETGCSWPRVTSSSNALLDAGCTAVVALVDAAKPPAVTARFCADVPIYAGGDQVRAMVTQLGMPQGIVALFARPPRATPEQLGRVATRLIAVEAVDNPINIGSIVRNAVALGWDGMLFDSTSADPLARRSLRVSMGHAIGFPAARCTRPCR